MADHQAAAEEWMRLHPRTMTVFEALARKRLWSGRRFGMKHLVEVVRWECTMTDELRDEPFKLNNNYTAHIARELCRRLPGLEALIERRRAGHESLTESGHEAISA